MTELAKRPIRSMYFDEYEVVEIISETRLSTIYKAKSHLYHNKFFAIKIVGIIFKKPAEILKKEAEILDELRECPYIVTSRGFRQTEDGIPYLVMDYIDGKHPLKGASTGYSKQRIMPVQVRTYVEHIAKALQYAHDRKICHCDIRPENILIVQDTYAILCDFGLAAREVDNSYQYNDERDEPDNELTLNKKYLPLERYGNKSLIEPRGDQYSLAAFVFECLCGEIPSIIGNPSIKQQVINEKYSPKIGEVLERALAGDMRFRYPSVTDFADNLIKALDDHIVKSQTQSSLSRSKPAGAPGITPAASSPELPAHSVSLQATPQNRLPRRMFSRRDVLAAAVALPAAVFLPMTWVRLWSGLSQLFPGQTPFGQTINVYQGHGRTVNAVSWSPDGQWIASASDDKTVQVWQPGGGSEPIIQQVLDGNVLDVTWSHYPSNNLIAFCSGKSVYTWDFSNASPVKVYIANSTVTSLAWSPDLSANLAIATDHGDVLVLRFVGKELLSRQPKTYTARTLKSTTKVSDIAWSHDGVYLAACSKSNSPYVWVWYAEDGSPQQLVNFSDTVSSIAWSPRLDNTIAVGIESGEPNMQVWNVFDRGIQPITYHHMDASTGIDSITWSPNIPSSSAGTYIAAGAESTGYVYVWNAQTTTIKSYDQHRQTTNANIDINALAWSPDSTLIASGGTDSRVRVWASGIGTF